MKKLVALLAAVAVNLSAVAGLQAATSGESIRIEYYDTGDFQNMVGLYIEYCNGWIDSSGTPSIYSKYYQYSC